MKIKKLKKILKCSSKYLRNAKYHHKAFILIKEIIVYFLQLQKKKFLLCKGNISFFIAQDRIILFH